MNRKSVVLVLLVLLANLSWAGDRATSKKQCLKNCQEVGFAEKKKRLDEQLLEIRKLKDEEKDIRKLNKLEEKEQDLLENYEDHVERTCQYICEGNP